MLKELIFVRLSLKGRITRKQFWWAWVLILVFGIGLSQAKASIGTLFAAVAYIYLTITIYGKRLHDIGKSSKGLIVPFAFHAACMIGSIVAMRAFFSNSLDFQTFGVLSMALGVLPIAVWIAYAFRVGLPLGNDGDNRFGMDPRDPAAIARNPGQNARA